jgi:hypothetical protein
MNPKIIAALAILAAIVSLGSSVRAHSPVAPSVNGEDYTITGDSLEGIDTRTAEDDFKKFFEGTTADSLSTNGAGNNQISNRLRLNQSISLPSTPIFLQPAQSTDGNDGVQVQLDLSN